MKGAGGGKNYRMSRHFFAMPSSRALRTYTQYTRAGCNVIMNGSLRTRDRWISACYQTGLPATRDNYVTSVTIRDARQHSGRKPLVDYCVLDGADSAGTSRSPLSLDARALRPFLLACTHSSLSLTRQSSPFCPHLYRYSHVRAHTHTHTY